MNGHIEKERKYYEIPVYQITNSTLRIKAESLEEAIELAKRAARSTGNTWVDDGEYGGSSAEYIAAYIQIHYPELNKEIIKGEKND